MRGKHDRTEPGGFAPRLIPARAGKTKESIVSVSFIWAHPRACGENVIADGETGDPYGSSPRVRGKRSRQGRRRRFLGLIPARAGKTDGPAATSAPSRAHPRACGENVALGRQHVLAVGSSPRVRGKPSTTKGMKRHERLIPARAGKTSRGPDLPSPVRAHPRACGENCAMIRVSSLASGSSPRVRGKRRRPRRDGQSRGLIPARAGKTPDDQPSGRLQRAHPRACGENNYGVHFRVSG